MRRKNAQRDPSGGSQWRSTRLVLDSGTACGRWFFGLKTRTTSWYFIQKSKIRDSKLPSGTTRRHWFWCCCVMFVTSRFALAPTRDHIAARHALLEDFLHDRPARGSAAASVLHHHGERDLGIVRGRKANEPCVIQGF